MNPVYAVIFLVDILNRDLPWITNRFSNTPKFMNGIKVGHVTSPEVTEASGICASRRHKHVLYTHNDSGDTHRIFAIDGRTGRTLAIITVNGTFHQDWEDIACGPCEGGTDHCVYIADTGGNAGGLSNTIYRIREPANITDQTVPLDSALAFSWDQKDCETVMVDPRGEVYVVSKVDDGRGKFVLLPSSAWGRPNRTYVHDGVYLKINSRRDNPTGGDISPDGTEILLKTYNGVYYWNITDGNYSAGIVKPPKILPYIQERQGEAVCWDSRGYGYYTLGEGLNSTLYYYQRAGQPGLPDD